MSWRFVFAELLLLFILAMETSQYYQCIQIQFMTHLGMKGMDIHRFLRRTRQGQALSQCTVYRWMKAFKVGRANCRDAARSSQPMKLTPQKLAEIRLHLNGDRTLSVRYLSTLVNLGFGTTQKALRRVMQLRKQPAHWIPHDLTAAQRQCRIDICNQLLRLRARNRDLTNQIIIGDESWILSYDLAMKQATASWLAAGKRRPTKARSNLCVTRLMLVCFFDAQGLIHREFVECRLGIGACVYLGILQRLRRSIRRKRPQQWNNCQWYLQHDGAPAHRANLVVNFLCQTNTQVLPHPAYSPDCAPADYWLFAHVKKHLKGCRFADVNALHHQVDAVLNGIPQVEYQHAMSSLIPHWRKCVAVQGHYFE